MDFGIHHHEPWKTIIWGMFWWFFHGDESPWQQIWVNNPRFTDEGRPFPVSILGNGRFIDEALHHNQDLLRAHQGTPVMNQGPKAGDSSKKGVTTVSLYRCNFQQLGEGVCVFRWRSCFQRFFSNLPKKYHVESRLSSFWDAHPSSGEFSWIGWPIFGSTQNMGQKNTGRCFTPEELSKKELFWGNFTGNFCLRTYWHMISNTW